jgi:hypothetical protein
VILFCVARTLRYEKALIECGGDVLELVPSRVVNAKAVAASSTAWSLPFLQPAHLPLAAHVDILTGFVVPIADNECTALVQINVVRSCS